jgi:hypothetical protein
MDVNAINTATATVDLARAGLRCDAKIAVTTDGPLALTLGGCGVVANVPKGTTTVQGK